MRIDTNIFIYREADQILTDDRQALTQILHENGALQLVHPLSVSELMKNPNPEKQKIMLSKTGHTLFLKKEFGISWNLLMNLTHNPPLRSCSFQ